jgi:hypothetical protein
MKKYPIEHITLPIDIAETAENRTRDLLSHWSKGSKNTLSQLAVSIYLQGIEDATKVIYQPN